VYPVGKRLGRPQGRSGRRGEGKILDSTGTRTSTLSRPVSSQSLNYSSSYTQGQLYLFLIVYIPKVESRM
jgi:hypothetical protein